MTAYERKSIEELLRATGAVDRRAGDDSAPITVHAAVSRFAVLYEKVRNAVDYRAEHLLRKAAIVRILKRQIALEGDAESVANQLVRELIAARYLPNAKLPESIIDEAAIVVRKFLVLKSIGLGDEKHMEWLLGITAAELEELVDDHAEVKGYVNFLYEKLENKIRIHEGAMDDMNRRLQVYIACHRSFVKADDEMLGFKLARAYQPEWMEPENWIDAPHEMAHSMLHVQNCVQASLKNALGLKFLNAVKPWAISLRMLHTVLTDYPDRREELLSDQEALHRQLEIVADKKIKESRAKISRGTFRAIIYLFITKILFALALEVPAELFLYDEIHYISLLINISFPPVLMFLVGSMIRMPGKENVRRIKLGADELLEADGVPEVKIRIPRERGPFGQFMFGLLYALTFLISFGAIFIGLAAIKFTWVSSLIFIFFLCIVSFFAFRLRVGAKEYIAIPRKGGIFAMFIDFFSIPVLRAGRWLSITVSRFNVFIFFFDFIIEAPFKIFLNILEEWSAFIKEKKDELE